MGRGDVATGGETGDVDGGEGQRKDPDDAENSCHGAEEADGFAGDDLFHRGPPSARAAGLVAPWKARVLVRAGPWRTSAPGCGASMACPSPV